MEQNPPQRRRILVIDDEPTLLELLRDGLSLLGGHDVEVASDGARGLERFYEVRPDCMVVDVRMPGLNGYQLVRALRGDPETAHTPIILLSALARDRDALAGMLSGADTYLFKPVKITELLAAVDRALDLTAEQRATRQSSLLLDEVER